jgi:hypothetical protein
MEAAGVEPDISVENTQLTDSENASNSSNAVAIGTNLSARPYRDRLVIQRAHGAAERQAQDAAVSGSSYRGEHPTGDK